jgi:hypothetical protein
LLSDEQACMPGAGERVPTGDDRDPHLGGRRRPIRGSYLLTVEASHGAEATRGVAVALRPRDRPGAIRRSRPHAPRRRRLLPDDEEPVSHLRNQTDAPDVCRRTGRETAGEAFRNEGDLDCGDTRRVWFMRPHDGGERRPPARRGYSAAGQATLFTASSVGSAAVKGLRTRVVRRLVR